MTKQLLKDRIEYYKERVSILKRFKPPGYEKEIAPCEKKITEYEYGLEEVIFWEVNKIGEKLDQLEDLIKKELEQVYLTLGKDRKHVSQVEVYFSLIKKNFLETNIKEINRAQKRAKL